MDRASSLAISTALYAALHHSFRYMLDIRSEKSFNSLKSLARPTGIEPVFSP